MRNWRTGGHLKATAFLLPVLTLLAAFCSYKLYEREHLETQSLAAKELPSPPAPTTGQPPSSNSIAALAGNVDIENRFQHTVIVTPSPSSPRGISKQCSGVLVSSRAVLTAGHCFCSKRKVEITGIEAPFIIDSAGCATTAIVTTLIYEKSEQGSGPGYHTKDYEGAVRLNPGFKIIIDEHENVSSSTGDLAIISLDAPVDAGLSPLPLARMDVQPNEPVILVGYGYDEVFGTLGGKRRYLKTKVMSLHGANGERALVEKINQTRYKGDSGGPCLRETVQGLELVGILSRGLGQDPSFTSTYPHGHWLQEEIQRASISAETLPR